jgi:hypothetical protein
MMVYLSLSLIPALTGSTFGTSPVLIAYVADLVGKRHRTVAMGVLFGFVMFGMSTGPMIEVYLPLGRNDSFQQTIYFCFVVLSILLTLWVQCCMRETSPELLLRRQQEKQRTEEVENVTSRLSSSSSSSSGDEDEEKLHPLNPCRSVHLMWTSPLMQVVGIVTLLSNISESGVIELFLIYLKDVVNFTAFDNAYLLLVLAIASCYTQTIVMRWFLVLSSETFMILCGLSANAIHLMMYALIGATHQKWIALLICTFSSLTFLPLSAFSSIVSKESDKRHRGLYLGTLISLRALSSVIGPICFTPLYVIFGKAPYFFPEMPFYVATLLVLCSLCFAAWGLPKVIPTRKRQPQDNQYAPPTYNQNTARDKTFGASKQQVQRDHYHPQQQHHHHHQHQQLSFEQPLLSPTPENLRRLSSITNDGDLDLESPEQLRMKRIEWMLNKE